MSINYKMNLRKPTWDNLGNIWEKRIEEIKLRTELPKYPFGLNSLDRITHGVTKGKVTVIAGRTSEAKTSLALQSAWNMADTGATVLYITLEDDSGQIAERIFCNLRNVDNQEIITGRVNKDILEDKTILECMKRIKLLPVENYGHNFEEIQYCIDTVQPKPDIVFLDYVQMIEQLPKESEYESLSRFSQQVKKFAEINNVGFVIVSQINRAGAKEGRPQAHHLQGCGRLEQVSDLLLILYCPYIYGDSSYDYDKDMGKGIENPPQEYVELTIAKNKNGIRNWTIPLIFTGRFYKFGEWKTEVSYESV